MWLRCQVCIKLSSFAVQVLLPLLFLLRPQHRKKFGYGGQQKFPRFINKAKMVNFLYKMHQKRRPLFLLFGYLTKQKSSCSTCQPWPSAFKRTYKSYIHPQWMKNYGISLISLVFTLFENGSKCRI